MAATIKDVAREAGVSVATVSRVLNGSATVRDNTRKVVLRIAKSLQYVPNATAQSLIRSRTMTLGVILPDVYGEFFSEILRGVDRVARDAQYHLLVSCSHSDPGELVTAVRAMLGRVDGLVVMTPHVRVQRLQAALPTGLPAILMGQAADGHVLPAVGFDNMEGARLAVSHFLALGHARIGMVQGPVGNADAEARARGYVQTMEAAGGTPLFFQGDFTESCGKAVLDAWLTLPDRPTALFCANDSMALGLMLAAREAGISIPQDLALIGFDGLALGRYVTPALTTIEVPMVDLGTIACTRLLQRLAGHENGSTTAEDVRLPVSLAVRGSCGASQHFSSPKHSQLP